MVNDKRNLVRNLLTDDNDARAGASTKVLADDFGLTILAPTPGELPPAAARESRANPSDPEAADRRQIGPGTTGAIQASEESTP